MLLRDLSDHGILRVTGEDRVRFLNGLLTNDVARLADGQGLHAAMLTVKGKLLGDLWVYREPEALHLDVVPAAAAKVREALDRHIIVDDVTVEETPGALLLSGEGSGEALAAALGQGGAALPSERGAHVVLGGLRVARSRDLGLDGYRVYGAAEALAALRERLLGAGARPLGEEEAERLRVEAGEPRYGVDMSEDQLPMEALLDDAVSHTKGCYMGQEPIARLTARGHVNKRLCGLRLDGEGAPPRGARLSGPGRDEAGTLTSVVRSPRHGLIALGYVHRTLWTPGTELVVHEGDATRRAVVTELPFAAASAVD